MTGSTRLLILGIAACCAVWGAVSAVSRGPAHSVPVSPSAARTINDGSRAGLLSAARHLLRPASDAGSAGASVHSRRGIRSRVTGSKAGPSGPAAISRDRIEVYTPTDGEGAPEGDWDQLSPQERIDAALERFEEAMRRAGAADAEGEAGRWRATANGELASVRADIIMSEGGRERYAELEARIGDQ